MLYILFKCVKYKLYISILKFFFKLKNFRIL